MISFKQLYHQFPRKFWIVVGVHFIDKIGATIVFPFFALYITGKFGVGMTEAGILLGLLSLAGILGSVIGGGLTDRLGRRKLILFGLVASALSALTLGSVSQFAWLFPVAALVGLFSEVGGPAHAFGPFAAGIVLDNYQPNLLWYLAALFCAVSTTGFYALHVKLGRQPRFAAALPVGSAGALSMEA